jgi:hypothetical protein
MNYKERLANIRKQQEVQAERDAFMQFMAAQEIPVDFVKLDVVPLDAIFRKMDRSSTEPYKVISGLEHQDWRQELMQAAASLMVGHSSFLFCWRDILRFENERLLAFDSAQLEKWLDAYNPGLRESDLLCCDRDRKTFIALLIDEHDVKFKQLAREDLVSQ